MRLRFLWPGPTKSAEMRGLQEQYLGKIGRMASWDLVETKGTRGLTERAAAKILDIEAQGLEKHLANDYIICLFDKGQEMTSEELAVLLNTVGGETARPVVFVVGGFLGLADRILRRAQKRLSLSRMTLSHELCRVVLLEQVYRSLTIMKGRSYAK